MGEARDEQRSTGTEDSQPRPGIPTEPEAQGATVTVGYVAAGAPLLVVPSLRGDDGVDGTTVSYFLAQNLEAAEGLERHGVLLVEFRAREAVPFGSCSPAQAHRLRAVAAALDDCWVALSSQPRRKKKGGRKSSRSLPPLAPGQYLSVA